MTLSSWRFFDFSDKQKWFYTKQVAKGVNYSRNGDTKYTCYWIETKKKQNKKRKIRAVTMAIMERAIKSGYSNQMTNEHRVKKTSTIETDLEGRMCKDVGLNYKFASRI